MLIQRNEENGTATEGISELKWPSFFLKTLFYRHVP